MILIVESGSTKTAWRLIKDPASAYESFTSAGINPYYQTTDEIIATQQEVLAGFKDFPIQAIYYYGTGVTGEAQCEVIAAAFRPFSLALVYLKYKTISSPRQDRFAGKRRELRVF